MALVAVAALSMVVGALPADGTVLGADGRTDVADTSTLPSRAIGLLHADFGGEALDCTAFLVDRNSVVTAGHCLNTGGASGVYADSVQFSAGADDGTAPVGSCIDDVLYISANWGNNAAAAEDWGVANLDCNVGDDVGWLGLRTFTDSQLLHRAVTVRGVANDGSMKTATDQIRRVAARTVNHRADTDAAQNGSPIYQPTGCNGACVLAIQSAGCAGTCAAPNGNRGIRLIPTMLDQLTEAASANDPRPDGLIRVGSGPFVGNGEINGSGIGQVRDAHPRRGTSATFTARFQSDGADPVDLRLRGTAGSSAVTVKYFSGATNITAAVRAGTYAINDLDVGQHRDIRIVATVGPHAPLNLVSLTLQATSQAAPHYRDLVRANVFPRA